MRAPSPSFQSQLVGYRQQLCAWQPNLRDDWKRQLMIDVVNRWIEHPLTEKTWNILRPKLPADVTAGQFIFQVIRRRILMEEIIIREPELPKVVAKRNIRTKRLLRAKNYLQLGRENQLQGEYLEKRDRLLGRKKQDAPRQLFMAGWSEKFKELCDEPLDEVVRVLAEVAFDQEVTIDSVRGARRDRHIRPAK
jgi:hypothetical protein